MKKNLSGVLPPNANNKEKRQIMMIEVARTRTVCKRRPKRRSLGLRCCLALFLPLVVVTSSWGRVLDWSGDYRVEFSAIDNSSLTSPKNSKVYGLHQLSLSPSIIVSDGFELHATVDLMGQRYPGYTAGSLFGGELPNGNQIQPLTAGPVSPFWSTRELFLTYKHPFATLTVGRAPLAYGLGLSYSAGKEAMDSWSTTRDLISYEALVSPGLKVKPLFAREASQAPWGPNRAEEFGAFAEYSSDAGSILSGFFVERRVSESLNAFDQIYTTFEGNPTTVSGLMVERRFGLLLGRQWTEWSVMVEAAVLRGETGVSVTYNSENIESEFAGVGILTQTTYRPTTPGWFREFEVSLGYASGDDPESANFEGFSYHPNHNLGLLLFNHSLGASGIYQATGPADPNSHHQLDEARVTNTVFLAPELIWDLGGGIDLSTQIILAMRVQKQAEEGSWYGVEWNGGLMYRLRKNATWHNTVGFFLPGDAFMQEGQESLGPALGLRSVVSVTF